MLFLLIDIPISLGKHLCGFFMPGAMPGALGVLWCEVLCVLKVTVIWKSITEQWDWGWPLKRGRQRYRQGMGGHSKRKQYEERDGDGICLAWCTKSEEETGVSAVLVTSMRVTGSKESRKASWTDSLQLEHDENCAFGSFSQQLCLRETGKQERESG